MRTCNLSASPLYRSLLASSFHFLPLCVFLNMPWPFAFVWKIFWLFNKTLMRRGEKKSRKTTASNLVDTSTLEWRRTICQSEQNGIPLLGKCSRRSNKSFGNERTSGEKNMRAKIAQKSMKYSRLLAWPSMFDEVDADVCSAQFCNIFSSLLLRILDDYLDHAFLFLGHLIDGLLNGFCSFVFFFSIFLVNFFSLLFCQMKVFSMLNLHLWRQSLL